MVAKHEKVLFISPSPYLQWRGSPLRVSFTVRTLVELGYPVDLLTLPIGNDAAIPGLKIIRISNPFRIKNIGIGPSFHKFLFDILLLIKGLVLIRREQYTVIHGVEEAGFLALILGYFAGCKVVYEKHSDPFSYRKNIVLNVFLSLYAFVERITIIHADTVICTGPGLTRQVNQIGRSRNVYEISDTPSSRKEAGSSNVEYIRQKYLTEPGEVLITFAGSFSHYQGIELLMLTIPEIASRCVEARFLVIGGHDADHRKWENVMQQLVIDKIVSFAGMLPPDELPDYFAASDILLSTRSQGLNTPMKLLDYLKAGRAIVATDLEANRLILNETIAVFAKPEPKAFADATINLIRDPMRRTALGIF